MSLSGIVQPQFLARGAGHALATVGKVVANLLLAPFHLFDERQLRSTLAQMNDHELADIGLSRQDIADATALPLTSEAGSFLSGRAGARRRRP